MSNSKGAPDVQKLDGAWRLCLVLVLSVTLLASVGSSTSHPQAIRELAPGNNLKNSFFAAGLAPWIFQVTPGGAGVQSQDRSNYAIGPASEKVTISQANLQHPEHVQLRQEGLHLVTDQQLSISFFARAASVRSLQIVLEGVKNRYQYDIINVEVTTVWEAHSFTFTPQDNDANVFLAFNLGGASPTVWLNSPFMGVLAPFFRGLNVFGPWQSGWGGTNAWASSTQLAYYASNHLMTLRCPILWEALQPKPGGPLDQAYLAGLDAMLSRAHQNNERISLTFINQGTRPANHGTPNGSNPALLADWLDVWMKLVQHILHNPIDNATVWAWDLDNEPYQDATWQTHDAQATIQAIRALDTTKAIIAMPNDEGVSGYLLASNFQGYSDPAKNIWYEDHIYFDADASGNYTQTYDQDGAYPTIGIDRVQPFIDWCAVHDPGKCILGETGVPGGWASGDATYTYDNPARVRPTNDPRWNTCLNNLLTYLDQQGISENYWEAGPYGDSDSVEPALVNGREYNRPQLQVLENHPGTWQP